MKDWKYNVNERLISLQEIIDAYKSKDLVEIFGTGTAAVICAVSKLKYNDEILKFNDEVAGELGTKLYEELTGIQYGRIPDRHGWIKHIG